MVSIRHYAPPPVQTFLDPPLQCPRDFAILSPIRGTSVILALVLFFLTGDTALVNFNKTSMITVLTAVEVTNIILVSDELSVQYSLQCLLL